MRSEQTSGDLVLGLVLEVLRTERKQKAVMLRSSVCLQGAATARSQPLDGCALTHLFNASMNPTKTCRYWQRMYDSLVGLRRLVLLRTYMIVSTFMWSSLYLRDILSQHYRPLHTTMTHAVDMQTRCTLVQCRTPRERPFAPAASVVKYAFISANVPSAQSRSNSGQ